MSFFLSTCAINTLFYIEGESNSRGFAIIDPVINSVDIGLQKSVKILDVNTFDVLHDLIIGGDNYNNNNLLGTVESGQRGKERVGFEMEIARRAKLNKWYGNPCHMIKVGQGGSIISEWEIGGSYDNLSLTAINNFKTLTPNLNYKTVVLYTLGINDFFAGTNIATWKSAVKARFEVLRNRVGSNTPIIVTQFQSITPHDLSAFNDAIEEIANEMPRIYPVDSTGCATYDGIHWGGGETGIKQLTGRMLDIAERLDFTS